MIDDVTREKIRIHCLSLVGNVWYEWGGQSIDEGRADCSGFVIEIMKRHGVVPDEFRDRRAMDLADVFPDRIPVDQSLPGDLAFYARHWGVDSGHVAVVVGPVDGVGSNCVVSMSNGRSGMTADVAQLVGAGLWVRPSINYRRDFLGVRRIRKIGS